ncbi:histidine--tRNA ligase [Membranicola marinus]|uniref:Histidine--tRNA ligase n=1 Tax=Membranihabitans marinus TaxID=1227546 RepID=A0A953LCF2_9BACT|nr:histidine--tRNA ligase [Membranihabitans marinus]MBY5959456.1 histidine--tRNA ligase [Membranihabitans marinus]
MNVGLPKGTRDFGPEELFKRRYIFNTIQKYFELYGYSPIETPSMENLSTLLGKYGDEGDQLLFKVLNNGDYLKKVPGDILADKDSTKATKHLAKRGLRYDLTIPFARYAVMHRNDINLPFKRYQIQPVWRADRPQKGRYQEFFQCDADVIGADSLQYEAECVLLFDQVFAELGLRVDIRINNRKLLSALCQKINAFDQLSSITTAIDKLDKVGFEGVQNILEKEGLSHDQINTIEQYLNAEHLQEIADMFQHEEEGQQGISEINQVYTFLDGKTLQNKLTFDPTLARGLSYYTGAILEVRSSEAEMGSIGGGGRYDNLTALFGGEKLGGMGISFGAERIYDIMEELHLLDKAQMEAPVLILTLDEKYHAYGFDILQQLRAKGIRSDLYPSGAKMKKQMKYANRINARYIMILGPEEWENKEIAIKNMITGKQYNVNIDDAVDIILEKTE